jgi:hypothetical protein
MPPTPDPDATIPEAQALRKYLSEFSAFATAHDPHTTAEHLSAPTAETLDRIAVLQAWLTRFADALGNS